MNEMYLVRTGSGNARGKSYYFDNLEEAIEKAKALQKGRKDNNASRLIKGTFEDGEFYYYIKNSIDYQNM